MAWKKEQNEYMDLMIRCMKNEFEGYYNRWVSYETTDRVLFCRMYEILVGEINKMRKVKSNYINVAFRDAMKDDEDTMREIVTYFTGQSMRGAGIHSVKLEDGSTYTHATEDSFIEFPEEVIA